LAQGFLIPDVSLPVAFKLRSPEIKLRFWQAGQLAVFVAVPEAPMYEDDLFAGAENQIGLAGKICSIQAISKPKAVNQPPDQQFWFGVFTAHKRHELAAIFGAKSVHGNLASGILAIIVIVETRLFRFRSGTVSSVSLSASRRLNARNLRRFFSKCQTDLKFTDILIF
jgi:hypothetical protein